MRRCLTLLLTPSAIWGASLLLGERLTGGELNGLVLILLGVSLGSGLVRLPRRAPLTQTP